MAEETNACTLDNVQLTCPKPVIDSLGSTQTTFLLTKLDREGTLRTDGKAAERFRRFKAPALHAPRANQAKAPPLVKHATSAEARELDDDRFVRSLGPGLWLIDAPLVSSVGDKASSPPPPSLCPSPNSIPLSSSSGHPSASIISLQSLLVSVLLLLNQDFKF